MVTEEYRLHALGVGPAWDAGTLCETDGVVVSNDAAVTCKRCQHLLARFGRQSIAEARDQRHREVMFSDKVNLPGPLAEMSMQPDGRLRVMSHHTNPVEPSRVRFYRDKDDWWVGYYRGKTHHYVCWFPTMVIRWGRRR